MFGPTVSKNFQSIVLETGEWYGSSETAGSEVTVHIMLDQEAETRGKQGWPQAAEPVPGGLLPPMKTFLLKAPQAFKRTPRARESLKHEP